MAGPIFGCSQDSAFVGAGAVFGAVQLSLFVAGAILGEVAVEFHAQFLSWQVQYLVQVTFRGSW